MPLLPFWSYTHSKKIEVFARVVVGEEAGKSEVDGLKAGRLGRPGVPCSVQCKYARLAQKLTRYDAVRTYAKKDEKSGG